MSDVNTQGQATQDHAHEPAISVKRIVRVFVILLCVTIVEVFWGMKVSHNLDHEGLKWVNSIFFLFWTLVKAGYIVAEFMHLRYEITNMIRSILIPLLLFLWFIVAFCLDGNSWLHLRQRYHQQNELPTPAAGATNQP